MAGTETKRIIELTEASTVQSGDFIAVDSNARGTKKVPTSALATSAALTAETNARAGADEQMSERMDGIEEQTALIQNPTKTLSGALVSFTDGADMPMVACTASIVPKQSGTGTPSPDNVRPISGWESVNVYDTGVNVWDEEWEQGGLYNSTGLPNDLATSYFRTKNFIPIKPSTTYYFKTSGDSLWRFYYDANKNFLSYAGGISNSADNTVANACYMKFVNVSGNSYDSSSKPISINYPSTDTEYHAYTGTTTTVNLGRTVYGGTLDVVSGVLTVDRAYKTVNDFNWTYNDANKVFWVNIPEMLRPCTLLSSHYSQSTVSSLADIPNYSVWNKSYGFTANNLAVKDTRFTDASSFKTNMSGVAISYELATPTTYTLTPTEVNTLLGENNVWADSGDVEITYRRDISIVINNLESALNG